MGFSAHPSKKAKKREREHIAARKLAFPTMDPLFAKTWAIVDEQKRSVGNQGWGNESGAIRIVRADDVKDAWGNGGQETGGWQVSVGKTTWMDGITTQYDETTITKWADPTPPKTEEELLRERVNMALAGWPWKGTPSKLVSVVSGLFVFLQV
jgi:hypothetical protein